MPQNISYKTGRFPAPIGFTLPARPSRQQVHITKNPEEFTVEQLLVSATMAKYKLSMQDVANILGLSLPTMKQYMAHPSRQNYRAMAPTIPGLLDAWCQTNRKS